MLLTTVDTLGSLSVGNGAFAYTTDVTGMQSFPLYYKEGVPLGTESEWGWDTHPNTENYTYEETLMEYQQYGRDITYSVQSAKDARRKGAIEYFRANPHRIQLGNVGMELYKKDGSKATISDISQINQELNLWTGVIKSEFTLEGVPVTVYTACHQEKDMLGFKVESKLLDTKQLKFFVHIPHPTAGWSDFGTFTKKNSSYIATVTEKNNTATINRQLDSLRYAITLAWDTQATMVNKGNNYFQLQPNTKRNFSFTCNFNSQKNDTIATFKDITTSSKDGWESFWKSGAAIDFTGSTDPRAHELERRIILSLYLTKLQCSGTIPPQETGLTFNSWYGKEHLEMHWWHGVHFALWGRPELLERSLPWYQQVTNKAKKRAQRQGFEGVRWQKMTGPYGNESPSSIGSFLIWQQPHFITFAELMYKAEPSKETLLRYQKEVFATADFMVSFAHYNSSKDRYELGPGVIPAQERFKAMDTYNPTYELAYWNWALTTAIEWKKRLGIETPKKWQEVLSKLSKLPIQDNVYLATENATDSYTNPEYKTDHPSVLGTFGMLPETPLLDKNIMNNTFNLIWDTWTWEDTWGWDFPMTAMTAARLGKPDKAVDALFMNVQTNTYLANGHNYQEDRLPIYLPGNGGLLTAVAMMCAGWDGCTEKNPGFPKDGSWVIKWEGLQPMF
ncbi:hypothetical protein NBRC110019_02880 [Neptunitalea chrysea]|uniref:Glycoside hydrolase family 65 n=1 Tax=Neptunitalea chrysea TaxID=1647581 RepID=A0A9W6B2T9_9FLAO|nr:hypothetical protein NBRC110019_02880 [Neptunitalea chrysea]